MLDCSLSARLSLAMAKKLDKTEFEVPQTEYVRDIENRVFQAIVWHALTQVKDIALPESNFIDALLGLGREGVDRMKAIHIDQDAKTHAVSVRVEVNIAYGVAIPEKADEIQALISREIPKFTGLHVAKVHVIFKGMISSIPKQSARQAQIELQQTAPRPALIENNS